MHKAELSSGDLAGCLMTLLSFIDSLVHPYRIGWLSFVYQGQLLKVASLSGQKLTLFFIIRMISYISGFESHAVKN